MKTPTGISEGPPRIYDERWPADTPYRPHTRKTGYHYGQRKLLMSEIEFLTLHGDRSNRVIYVGAAPGLHLRVLVDCFPMHTFVLYDPCPFHPRLLDGQWAGRARIEFHNEMFTADLAQRHAEKDPPCLFISDIRHKESHEQFPSEACVRSDMADQRTWVEIMQPAAAMLKFRLPWCDPAREEPHPMEYLDGELRLPVWGCPSTTETRLVLTPPFRARTWDCAKYERHMFYFNTVLRAQTYDEAAEQWILQQYVQRCAPRQKVSIVRQRMLRELLSHTAAQHPH